MCAGDKGNFLNQILAMIWPFGDGEHKGGGWQVSLHSALALGCSSRDTQCTSAPLSPDPCPPSQVVTMFLLGAFRTFLMDRSAGMSRTLISTVFKQA